MEQGRSTTSTALGAAVLVAAVAVFYFSGVRDLAGPADDIDMPDTLIFFWLGAGGAFALLTAVLLRPLNATTAICLTVAWTIFAIFAVHVKPTVGDEFGPLFPFMERFFFGLAAGLVSGGAYGMAMVLVFVVRELRGRQPS